MSDHTEVVVDELPLCDLDRDHGVAGYDAKLKGRSSWAYLCDGCFKDHGRGLGLGVGQRLILRDSIAGKAVER